MLGPHREVLSTRVLAILPVVLFLPTLYSYVFAPGSSLAEYSGILFHVAILFLVGRLPAAEWAKGAAYGWLALDITTGVIIIHGVPYDQAVVIRLAGHVLAGVWFVSASLVSRGAVRVVGVVLGLWLSLYTMCSDFLSLAFLRPGASLMIIWFILLAVQSGSRRKPEAEKDDAVEAGAAR